MGLFSAVIDRSPIDKFGVGANADSLMSLANISLNRSQELWDPQSKRNQMFHNKTRYIIWVFIFSFVCRS